MHQSKLLTLLRTLEPDELPWFKKFLRSPYHNANPLNLRCFEVLRPFHPGFTDERLTKQFLHRRLFPGQDFGEQRIRKRMSELNALLEQFFVVHRHHTDPARQQRELTAELGRRNAYRFFERETQRTLDADTDVAHRSADHFLRHFLARERFYVHPLTVPAADGAEQLRAMSDALDRFYLLKKMFLAGSILSMRQSFEVDTELEFVREIIDWGNRRGVDDLPALKLQLQLYELCLHPHSDDRFLGLRDDLLDRVHQLDLQTGRFLLEILINYTLYRSNLGNRSFLLETFKLYRTGITKQLLVANGRISTTTYTNIMGLAIELDQLDFVHNFARNYADHLADRDRPVAEELTRAQLDFQRRHYREVTERLSRLTIGHPITRIVARRLSLRALVELRLVDPTYDQPVLSELDAFERFLQRHRVISDTRRESNLNFLRLLRRILLIEPTKASRTVLDAAVREVPLVVHRVWLLEVLERWVG